MGLSNQRRAAARTILRARATGDPQIIEDAEEMAGYHLGEGQDLEDYLALYSDEFTPEPQFHGIDSNSSSRLTIDYLTQALEVSPVDEMAADGNLVWIHDGYLTINGHFDIGRLVGLLQHYSPDLTEEAQKLNDTTDDEPRMGELRAQDPALIRAQADLSDQKAQYIRDQLQQLRDQS